MTAVMVFVSTRFRLAVQPVPLWVSVVSLSSSLVSPHCVGLSSSAWYAASCLASRFFYIVGGRKVGILKVKCTVICSAEVTAPSQNNRPLAEWTD